MLRKNELKDIFVIHSKQRRTEREVAGTLSTILSDAGYSVYDYKDWDWENTWTEEEFSHDSGEFIDPVRKALGEPPLGSNERRAEVDDNTVKRMLRHARLVILIHPDGRKMSSGVSREIQILRRVHKDLARDPDRPGQCLLQCSWDPEQSPSFSDGSQACVVLERFSRPLSESPSALVNVLRAAVEAASMLLTQTGESVGVTTANGKAQLEQEVAKVYKLMRRVRQCGIADRDVRLDSDLSTLLFVVSKYHVVDPSDGDVPVHPLVALFRQAVTRHVELALTDKGPSRLPSKDLVTWRRSWVSVLSELCEVLYRVYCLPHDEWRGGHVVEFHRFISRIDSAVLVHSIERFCGQTGMNHLLDSVESCTILADCLVSLASLLSRVVGAEAAESFQIRRLAPPRLFESFLLLHNGYWPSGRQEQVRVAFENAPFPFARFACMGD